MSYILHIESGEKFNIDGKTAAEVQTEIKAAGLMIGNVTLRRMLEGQLESVSGFEVIQSLNEDEQKETETALAEAKAKVEETQAEESNEKADEAQASIPATEQTDDTPAEDNSDEPADDAEPEPTEEEKVKADEIRRKMLGANVANAIKEASNPTDDASLAAAQAVLDKKAKDNKPVASNQERKRRHNKREENVEAAFNSDFGPLLKAVQEKVTPASFLSYVNPDLRWFQFPITELADKENLHARTNTYLDLSPISGGNGGWSFGLYVAGKSFTKRQKVKENDADKLVEAINAWLPTALEDAKKA